MREKTCVIGLGEVGSPLYSLLSRVYQKVGAVDIKTPQQPPPGTTYNTMNVCIPYGPDFVNEVIHLQKIFQPTTTIIHSTVPVGTTVRIPDAVHSPVLGDHTNMFHSLSQFVKWIGGSRQHTREAQELFVRCGMICHVVDSSDETELLKLLCLTKYGLAIAFNRYEVDLFQKLGLPVEDLKEWDMNYNKGLAKQGRGHLSRPIIKPQQGTIGGHCIIPAVQLLQDMVPNHMLEEILFYGPRTESVTR